MAANSGILVQALIDGGISAAAARLIANALANAATPQRSQARDVSDQTPVEQLRMIDRDRRLYQFTNLDYSSEDPYERTLRSNPGQYASPITDHPYKDAQPVLPVPPLSQARISGGQYIRVDNSVESGAPLATVGLNVVQSTGTHLRVNQATNAVEAVPLSFTSPQGLVTAEATEASDRTAIELQVRSLSTTTVVQADGTSVGLKAWPDTSVTPTTVFTSWAQANVLNKADAASLLSAIGAPSYSTGTWTPSFAALTTSPTVTYNTTLTSGVYTKIGRLVHVSGRITLTAVSSAGSGVLTVAGLPFPAGASNLWHSGAVSYKTGWTTQGPTHCYVEPSVSYFIPSYHTATSIALLTGANLSATSDMLFSLVYAANA